MCLSGNDYQIGTSGELPQIARDAMALKGEQWLSDVPGLLKKLIKKDLWRKRIVEQTGEVVEFNNFAEFVRSPPLEGLGTDIKTLQRVCADDREALDLLDQVVAGKAGAPIGNKNALGITVDNINDSTERPAGTSRAYALRKLRHDAPELHEQVLAGALSAAVGPLVHIFPGSIA